MHHIPVTQLICPRNLLICQPDPAGAQAKHSGQDDQLLAVIPNLLFGILPFGPGHHKIVLHAGKIPVLPNAARKGLWLFQHQLYVEPALGVCLIQLCLEHLNLICFYWLTGILPDRVPGPDGFLYGHTIQFINQR